MEYQIEKSVEGCEPIRVYFGNSLEMQKENNIAKLKKEKFENSYILENIMRFYRRRKGAKNMGKSIRNKERALKLAKESIENIKKLAKTNDLDADYLLIFVLKEIEKGIE